MLTCALLHSVTTRPANSMAVVPSDFLSGGKRFLIGKVCQSGLTSVSGPPVPLHAKGSDLRLCLEEVVVGLWPYCLQRKFMPSG